MNIVKEKQLYESIGIRQFQNILLSNNNENKGIFRNKIKNQGLSSISLDGILEYKKMILFNAKVHGIAAALLTLPLCDRNISALIPLTLNGYFIILQRYNFIRIMLIEEKYKEMMEHKNDCCKNNTVIRMKSVTDINGNQQKEIGQLIRVKKRRGDATTCQVLTK